MLLTAALVLLLGIALAASSTTNATLPGPADEG
jgi:hypothetical protein